MRITIPEFILQYPELDNKDYYFISLLNSAHNSIKKSEIRNRKEKSPIHKYSFISSKHLRSLFGERYREHIERLRKFRIIDVNDHYKPQGFITNFGFTKSYKILPYDANSVIELEVSDKVTLNSIKRFQEWNNRYIDKVIDVQNKNLQMLENTEGLDLNTRVDGGYKLHNDLVDTKKGKARRQTITYKGEKLTQLDIKNTYPSLIYYLIPNRLKEEPDVKFYLKMVEAGSLIFSFKELLVMKFPNITDQNVKKGLNSFLNYRRHDRILDPKVRAIDKIFKERFPNVYQTINEYRGNRSYLTWTTLAKIESTLMNKFLLHCDQRFKNPFPVIRIHDCLMVPKGFKGWCIMEFNSFCKNELGYNLVIRQKED